MLIKIIKDKIDKFIILKIGKIIAYIVTIKLKSKLSSYIL